MILKVLSVVFALVLLFKLLFAGRMGRLRREVSLIANVLLALIGVYVVVVGALWVF